MSNVAKVLDLSPSSSVWHRLPPLAVLSASTTKLKYKWPTVVTWRRKCVSTVFEKDEVKI